MLTELRRYAVTRGAMDLMHDRMTKVVLPLFNQHGAPRPSAIWDNCADTSTFTWLIEWPDFVTRAAAWAGIAPAFAALRQREGTPEFVTRTTLTLIAPWTGAPIRPDPFAACETMWHVQPKVGCGSGFVERCTTAVFERLNAMGATAVAGANLLFGDLPSAVVLASWPDTEARARGMAELARSAADDTLAQLIVSREASVSKSSTYCEALDRVGYF